MSSDLHALEEGVSSSSKSDDDTRRKRGRPKGAKTEDIPHVICIPECCPKCYTTEYLVVKKLRESDTSGMIRGNLFNKVTHRRVICKGCKNQYIRREYRRFNV